MTTHPEGPFDRLLRALPVIAERVNAFASEDIQRDAFGELIDAFHDQADQDRQAPGLREVADDPLCLGTNARGRRCRQRPSPGRDFCWRHNPQREKAR